MSDAIRLLDWQNVVMRFLFGVDQQDLQVVEQCLALDCRSTIYVRGEKLGEFVGRDAIVAVLSASAAQPQVTVSRHVITNPWLESSSEDTAIVMSYQTTTEVGGDGARVLTTGVCRDVIRRTSDGWLLAEREIRFDASLPGLAEIGAAADRA